MGVNTIRTYPNDLLRALACLCLGSFAFFVSTILARKEINGVKHIFLSMIEVGTFLFATYIFITNKKSINLVELLFLIVVIILFSRKSITSKLQGNVWEWLGKMSVPAFIFHWNIGSIANMLADSIWLKTIMYYCGTIVLSCVLVLLSYLRQKEKIVNSQMPPRKMG